MMAVAKRDCDRKKKERTVSPSKLLAWLHYLILARVCRSSPPQPINLIFDFSHLIKINNAFTPLIHIRVF